MKIRTVHTNGSVTELDNVEQLYFLEGEGKCKIVNWDCISREKTLDKFCDYVLGGMSMNDFDALYEIVEKMPPKTPTEWRCDDCKHYGELSLDCSRCDDDCSMFELQEKGNNI